MGINRGRQRRGELREQAKVLAEERATRTPAQQLALLDERLGAGVGAGKERAQLLQMIADLQSVERVAESAMKKIKK
jgi:hypothetical protein